MQKTAMENWKEQWSKNFPQFMEMQDNWIDSLPDELITPPGAPAIKPKKVMEKVKEFQEMAHAHAEEQANAHIDFVVKAQEQAKEAVKDAVKNVEEGLDKAVDNSAE